MSKPAVQEQRGAGTRRALLAATATLIPELGWGSVTTRAIAERAGVRPGVVHYHFDAVDALLVAAVTEAASGVAEQVEHLLDATDDVDAGIDALLTTTTAMTDDPSALLLLEASLAASRTPALRAALAAVLVRLRTRIAAWLTDRGFAGDADATAATLAAALDGWALHRAADPTLDPGHVRSGLHALVRGDAGRTS